MVGSLLDFVYAPDDIQATLERMTSPQCKMISLTITEKGYCWDKDGDLDLEHPLIVRDLADVNKPASAMGYITAAVCYPPIEQASWFDACASHFRNEACQDIFSRSNFEHTLCNRRE